jgi:hypothetical protein
LHERHSMNMTENMDIDSASAAQATMAEYYCVKHSVWIQKS